MLAGVYATDPNFGALKGIMNANELYQYDASRLL